MKDKTVAAILAFFGGIVGLHRFYLGQRGWGFANVAVFSLAIGSGDTSFFVMLTTLAAVFGVIDSIGYLSMSEQDFDRKYNEVAPKTKHRRRSWQRNPKNTEVMNDRERRFQQRQRERAEKERQRELAAKRKYGQRTTRAEGYGRHIRRSANSSAEREAGVRYFKDFDYPKAIESFTKALEKNPRDVAAHFNIACAYSCEENAAKAFYHIDRAVALGFDDFSRIKNHDSLAYLRIQDSYPDFAASDFRLTADLSAAESDLNTPLPEERLPPPAQDDLLEQLQRLANLREKGLLTENEFVAQKRRLLG